MIFNTQLHDLSLCGKVESHRSSSYARDGSNLDFRRIPAGKSIEILSVEGPGIINHIWFALNSIEPNYLRGLVIRAWWDGESEPSVNCPLGDFLGVGHAITSKYECAAMNMVRGNGERGGGTGGNVYIPMPFEKSARIEIANESYITCFACYYQIEWMKVDADSVKNSGRFHALWHRENPCRATSKEGYDNIAEFCRYERNINGGNNFSHPFIEGTGRFLGCNLSIDNIDPEHFNKEMCCYNEGDEWIYIDDRKNARIRGTGTEDYFNDAWGMTGHAGLWAGASLFEETQKEMGKRPKGTCYRFHIPDPLYFNESFRITFEHGHANHQANDLAVTCYWYQHEPHASFPLLAIDKRLPVRDIGDPTHEDERKVVSLIGAVVDRYYDIFLNGKRSQIKTFKNFSAMQTFYQILKDFQSGTQRDFTVINATLAEINQQLSEIETVN